MKATYRYKYAGSIAEIRERNFTTFSMPVEVLERINMRYKIKFLAYHADGRPPGTIILVQARNLHDRDNAPMVRPKNGNKLPYKD